MPTKSLHATFMRGGTSNGIVLHRHHLPPNREDWQPVLAGIMGSPDPYGRQLNGMGQGFSSSSKVCVIEKSSREDADVDYTFVQVGIQDGLLDFNGNCGNMSSAIGPWSFEEGLLGKKEGKEMNGHAENGHGEKEREVSVRIFNTNTNKIIVSTFTVSEDGRYDPFGSYSIDGVPGTGSRITLSFLDPSGAKTGKALPTGNPVDTLTLPDGSTIRATLSDIANPGVFVLAEDLGIPGDSTPAELEKRREVMEKLESIRKTAGKLMGLDPNAKMIPGIAVISRPGDEHTANIQCRALSMGLAHKAVPVTLGLNLGTSTRMPGTLPNLAAKGAEGLQSVTVAHPSGKIEVGGVFENGKIKSALLHRTARVMMKGEVYYTVKSDGR